MRLFVWLILGLGACAPPPVPDALLPRLQILTPEDGFEIVLRPAQTEDESGCVFEITVTVDADNFDVHQPAPAEEEAEGEGHWHLYPDGEPEAYQGGYGPTATYIGSDASPGNLTMVAELHTNQHAAIEDDGAQDRVEVVLTRPDPCE